MTRIYDNEKKCSDGRNVIVYGLSSSRNGEIRYIGQTVQPLKKRLNSHIHVPAKARKRHCFKWIKKEMSLGYIINITVILNGAVWNETEKAVIKEYRESGFNLVNHTDGGEGVLGRKKTAEERLKISLAHKGRKKSPEHLAKLLAFNSSRKGKPLSNETRAKLSAALKGKRPKNLEELWAKSTGRAWSEKQREATMAAHAAKKLRGQLGLVY